MNTRAVREGITADNRFVQLYRHITQLADQLAGAVNFLMFDVGVHDQSDLGGFSESWQPLPTRCLPARSPIPLMVHSIWRAPICTAPIELPLTNPNHRGSAPRSPLYQCLERG